MIIQDSFTEDVLLDAAVEQTAVIEEKAGSKKPTVNINVFG